MAESNIMLSTMKTKIDMGRRAEQLSSRKFGEQISLLKNDNQRLIQEIGEKNSQIAH
jgi:hypothetical protein